MLCTVIYGQKNNLSSGFKLKPVTIYYTIRICTIAAVFFAAGAKTAAIGIV